MFAGALVALVTPFDKSEKVDYQKLEKLIQFQLDSGIQGILVCASTGEGTSLTSQERTQIIQKTLQLANVPVLVGCSCGSIQTAIQEINNAEQLGANGVLVPPPFYIKPTQDGIIRYYEEIIKQTNLPIVMYNIPSRCSVTIQLDTISALMPSKRIVALKDATRNFENLTLLHYKSPELTILSGDDPTLPACLAHGGSGAISALANVCPKLIRGIIDTWKSKEIDKFQAQLPDLMKLSSALSVTTNPISLKYLAKHMNIDLGYSRPPLVDITKNDVIDKIMNNTL